MRRRLWMLPLLGLLALGGSLFWNSCSLRSRQPLPAQATAAAPSSAQALMRLSQAIALPTVSWQNPAVSSNRAFDRLHALFVTGYPQVYQRLKPQRLGNSLLITWPGQDPKAKAVLLAAHLDVVPAEQPELWQHPPFSGHRAAGMIWGRGSLDDKASALALLEALESSLRKGLKPKQTLYFAFGEDEEIGGQLGARRMAQRLKSQGVQLAGVLDEGLVMVPGSLIGLKPAVALIGIAEKGYLTLELKVEQSGGHSSMPSGETAVDLLARALLRLRAQPLPARFAGPAGELLTWLGPEMQGIQRLALANRWLFEPLLLRQFSAKPSTNALIRTTIAPTMLSGSAKENVLANQARALVNLRVLPGDTPEMIVAHFNAAINDPRVKVKRISDPAMALASKVSRTDGPLFKLLSTSIRTVFKDTLVAPSLVLAATDSRHYEPLTENIYRFQPVYLTEVDLGRIHGRNERISEKAYFEMIRFYQHLLSQL